MAPATAPISRASTTGSRRTSARIPRAPKIKESSSRRRMATCEENSSSSSPRACSKTSICRPTWITRSSLAAHGIPSEAPSIP
ncbi:hypothetical protein Naga_102408g1 [Nannochloropsis gaditana]|uniref:Uncharacterized protein n=1 Tax=Nannochloropsis gaditana TaxID=72520 RepID=W7T7X4_9STRA|nr:hypothetical protein Naga_102408g1 [Nannochloropsis gaditana]